MAGSITTTTSRLGAYTKYSLAWLSDASGNVSANSVSVKTGELIQVTFIPGTGGTQPSDAYDMTIADVNGVDVLGGGGANLSQTTITTVACPISTYFRRHFEEGTLTPSISNAGNAKTGTIVILVR
jgi:hypothetical protein